MVVDTLTSKTLVQALLRVDHDLRDTMQTRISPHKDTVTWKRVVTTGKEGGGLPDCVEGVTHYHGEAVPEAE